MCLVCVKIRFVQNLLKNSKKSYAINSQITASLIYFAAIFRRCLHYKNRTFFLNF